MLNQSIGHGTAYYKALERYEEAVHKTVKKNEELGDIKFVDAAIMMRQFCDLYEVALQTGGF